MTGLKDQQETTYQHPLINTNLVTVAINVYLDDNRVQYWLVPKYGTNWQRHKEPLGYKLNTCEDAVIRLYGNKPF